MGLVDHHLQNVRGLEHRGAVARQGDQLGLDAGTVVGEAGDDGLGGVPDLLVEVVVARDLDGEAEDARIPDLPSNVSMYRAERLRYRRRAELGGWL